MIKSILVYLTFREVIVFLIFIKDVFKRFECVRIILKHFL